MIKCMCERSRERAFTKFSAARKDLTPKNFDDETGLNSCFIDRDLPIVSVARKGILCASVRAADGKQCFLLLLWRKKQMDYSEIKLKALSFH